MRLFPVANTSRGIFSLVANEVPDSVILPRARAVLNSSVPCWSASITNPRSARVASIAESSTSVSTSSSTRPEPSARSPSSTAAICAKSLSSDDERTSPDSSPSARNTISMPSRWPRRMASPCISRRSDTGSPFT